MLLEKIAQLFPNQISLWPVAMPSKALPIYIRTQIKNTFGRDFSSNDFNKKILPNRFGVFTRKFQFGDPLKTLSRAHLLRLNLFVTKLDVSPGRKNILVLFHNYENMTFMSHESKVNKGQLANALCAILEKIHKNLGQNFTIKPLQGENFFEECQKIQKIFRNYEKIYFLSDFLFNPHSIQGCAEDLKKTIQVLNLKNCVFLFIRDPLEYVEQNNSQEIYELSPWSPIQNKFSRQNLYADNSYKYNLREQILCLETVVEESRNVGKVLTSKDTLVDFIKFLNRS